MWHLPEFPTSFVPASTHLLYVGHTDPLSPPKTRQTHPHLRAGWASLWDTFLIFTRLWPSSLAYISWVSLKARSSLTTHCKIAAQATLIFSSLKSAWYSGATVDISCLFHQLECNLCEQCLMLNSNSVNICWINELKKKGRFSGLFFYMISPLKDSRHLVFPPWGPNQYFISKEASAVFAIWGPQSNSVTLWLHFPIGARPWVLSLNFPNEARSLKLGFPSGYLKMGKLTEENHGPAPRVYFIWGESQAVLSETLLGESAVGTHHHFPMKHGLRKNWWSGGTQRRTRFYTKEQPCAHMCMWTCAHGCVGWHGLGVRGEDATKLWRLLRIRLWWSYIEMILVFPINLLVKYRHLIWYNLV